MYLAAGLAMFFASFVVETIRAKVAEVWHRFLGKKYCLPKSLMTAHAPMPPELPAKPWQVWIGQGRYEVL